MSKPNRKRLNLSTVRAQRMEAQGDKFVEVEFEDTDGEEQVVRFLRQSWWPLPLMKQLTSLSKMAENEGDIGATEALSGLDQSINLLRKVAHDKGLFDKLHETLTVGDFNAVMELVTGGGEDAEAGVDEGESSSSSE